MPRQPSAHHSIPHGMTKADFTHLLTAEGYLPHEIDSLWRLKPTDLPEDELDPDVLLEVARKRLPYFIAARQDTLSEWD